MKKKYAFFALLVMSVNLAFSEILATAEKEGVSASDVVDVFIEKVGELPFGYSQVFFQPGKNKFFRTYEKYDEEDELYYLTLEVQFGYICIDNFSERSKQYKEPIYKHDMKTQKGRLGFASEMIWAIKSYPTDFEIDMNNPDYAGETVAAFNRLMSRLSEEERNAYKRLMNFFEQLVKMLK